MKNKNFLITLITSFILFTSCTRDSVTSVNTNPRQTDKTEMRNLVVSPQFSYSTTQKFNFRLETILPSGDDFIKAGKIQILNANPRIKGSNAEVIAEGSIDGNDGNWIGSITIPSSLEKLYIKPNYIGLIDLLEVDVKSVGNGTYVKSLVVDENYTGGIDGGVDSTFSGARTGTSNYNYVCNYNNQGKPNCLNNTNEVFSSQFLQSINLSLPESRHVNTHHPEYLNPSAIRHIRLIAQAVVEVGFISEGAAYLNALGYYTYPLNNPPITPPAITSSNVKIIFPNASFSGSGGQLVAGNKVTLGTFPAGTGIGWFLVSDGYNNNQKKVIEDSWKKTMYSVDAWNPASAAELKQQLIMLNDPTSQRMILAFEDIRRDAPGDNDFNDCVFFAKATPASAVDPTDIPVVDNGPRDRDGDGIPDEGDDYPDDNQRAHNVYPNGTGYSTLAFEDLWPSEGDYDFNDYVVNYNYKLVTNAQNNVKDIVARYKVRAIGASYRNGFAVSFDNINQSTVSQVIGGRLTANRVTRRANGTEEGINNAVIWVTDDARNSVSGGSGQFVNTLPGEGVYTSDTIGVVIRFGTAVTPASLGASPFNSFITCDLAGSSLGVTNLLLGSEVRRGVEVHLPDQKNTSKAITRLFGTKSDNSVPATNRYYKTARNLPFGLNVPVEFKWPIEKNQITKSHLKFGSWAESGGTQFPDWYMDKPGYRDNTKIY